MKKFKHLQRIIYDPNFEVNRGHPLERGELVLFNGMILGEDGKDDGHCAVIKYSGLVIWMVHPQDFRLAKEDEY